MIQAKELKIDNWVSFKNLWNGRVRRVNFSGIVEFYNNAGIFDEEALEPIEITKELLYKIGATDFPDGESIILNNQLIRYADCRSEFYHVSTSVTIKSLHQLQNLYFALTGTDLDIKL